MEKVINSYECLFIVEVANGEEATAAKVNKFTALISNNAEVVEVNEWGKRRLAYPINDQPEGHYVIVTFKSAPEFIYELERKFNIDESVMRYLVTKLDYEAVAKTAEAVEATEEVPATTEE